MKLQIQMDGIRIKKMIDELLADIRSINQESVVPLPLTSTNFPPNKEIKGIHLLFKKFT